jgi:hypothetical protein
MVEIFSAVMKYYERPGGSSVSTQFSVNIADMSVVFGTWLPIDSEMKHIVNLMHIDPVIIETCQWLKENEVAFPPCDESSSSIHYLHVTANTNRIMVNVESKTISVNVSSNSFFVKEFRSCSTNIDVLSLSPSFGRLFFSSESDLHSSGFSVDISIDLVQSSSSCPSATVLKFTLLKGEFTAFDDSPIFFVLPDLFAPHSVSARKELFYLCVLRMLEKADGEQLAFRNYTSVVEKIIRSLEVTKVFDSRNPVTSIKILVDFSLINLLLLGRDGSSVNLKAKSAVLSLLLLSNAEALTVKVSLHDTCLVFMDSLTGKSWIVSKFDLLSMLFTSLNQEKLLLDLGFEKCQLFLSLEVMLMVEVRLLL